MSSSPPSAVRPPCRRPPRSATMLLLSALALPLSACGGDDASRTTSARPAPPRTTTEVADLPETGIPLNGTVRTPAQGDGASAGAVVAEGLDRRRGTMITLRRGRGAEARRIDATVTVTRASPASARRRLAAVSGYRLQCDAGTRPGSSSILDAVGPRSGVRRGTVLKFGSLFEDSADAPITDAIVWCRLFLSERPRGTGSTSFTSMNGKGGWATVRFR